MKNVLKNERGMIMKNVLKNERGITLMALVITVIVLLILASIGIYDGLGTIRSSKYMAFKTELELLQSSVNKIYSENPDNLESYGVDMTSEQKEIFNVTEVSNILNSLSSDIESIKSGFKYFSKDYIVSDLGIQGITNDYYINLSKRLIIAVDPFEYEGTTYYMIEQMDDGIYNVAYNREVGDVIFTATSTIHDENTIDINISDIHTVNDQYINKWQIRYRIKGTETWNTTEEFTGNSYTLKVNTITDYELQVFHYDIVQSEIVTISIGKPDSPEVSDTIKITKDYGVIEVKFLKDTGYEVSDTPNAPILKEGMKAVYWDDNGNEVTQGDSNFDINLWYNYVEQNTGTENGGTSHWANAKITQDGVDSYFVWIPRYAYRILYFDTATNENNYRKQTNSNNQTPQGLIGYMDARGFVDKDGKRPSNEKEVLGISVNEQYFRPHPAFEGNVEEGGWTDNIKGIWVGKYETSQTNNKISIVPNAEIYRGLTIGQMYTNANNYNKNLNSHLLKNSECGATAYLAESKYGRNGTEISINNSRSYITGNSGGTPNATPNEGITYPYNSKEGFLASTTGNIYGIYDMCGGAWEYVSNYYNNSSDLNLYETYGSSFASKGGNSTKFSTVYSSVDISQGFHVGDATYEVAGWNGDYEIFISDVFPFLSRGGFYDDAYITSGIAGIFAFGTSKGTELNSDTFRMALIV